jgi:predicted acetyltransferase
VIHIDKYENMYIIKIVNENDYSYNLGSQSLKRGGIIQPTEMRRSGPMISLSPFYA